MVQAIVTAQNVRVKAIIVLQRSVSTDVRADLRSSFFVAGAVKTLLPALQLPYWHHEGYRTAVTCLLAFAHWPLRAGCGHLVWEGLQTRV